MRITALALALLALALLSACTTTQELPTLIPSATPTDVVTPEPSPTPIRRATLPPTWTPEGVFDESAGQSDSSEPTADPAASPQPTVEVFIPATPLEVCNTFGEDLERNSRTFEPGEPAQVYWTAVDGAASYYVELLDEFGNVVVQDYTLEPTYVFQPDVFESGRLYGWQAYPLDSIGQQMCLARGAELFPRRPF